VAPIHDLRISVRSRNRAEQVWVHSLSCHRRLGRPKRRPGGRAVII
jgi:hypothetical protein